jgi:hypothetical protein
MRPEDEHAVLEVIDVLDHLAPVDGPNERDFIPA